MAKKICTGSLFALFLGAFIATCEIQVRTPSWFDVRQKPVPLIAIVATACGVMCFGVLVVVGLWRAADVLCTKLRGRRDKYQELLDESIQGYLRNLPR